jgi:hypothetical protein
MKYIVQEFSQFINNKPKGGSIAAGVSLWSTTTTNQGEQNE